MWPAESPADIKFGAVITVNPKTLREQFSQLLAQAAAKRHFILVLDALNQDEDKIEVKIVILPV